MGSERKGALSGNHRAQTRTAQLAAERDGHLPVWVRAPKYGHEFFSGWVRVLQRYRAIKGQVG